MAGILLGKGIISGEIMSKMLVISYTLTEEVTILIEVVKNMNRIGSIKVNGAP